MRKIEELFTELDAGVAALERVRANLKRYRAAVLKAAVEGELTADWRTRRHDIEPADVLLQRILRERRDAWEQAELARYAKSGKTPPKGWQGKYKAPAAPDTTDLPELPDGWCWATVEQLAAPEPRSIQSGPFGSALLHSEFQQTGILVVGIDISSSSQYCERPHAPFSDPFEVIEALPDVNRGASGLSLRRAIQKWGVDRRYCED